MTRTAVLDGLAIRSVADFHHEIAAVLDFPSFYGENFDALWDVMTGMIDRPVTLIWRNAEASKIAMPEAFETIIDILRDVEKDDLAVSAQERFTFRLE